MGNMERVYVRESFFWGFRIFAMDLHDCQVADRVKPVWQIEELQKETGSVFYSSPCLSN